MTRLLDLAGLREKAESYSFDHQYVDIRKDEFLALLNRVEELERDRDSYANSDFERQLDEARQQLASAEQRWAKEAARHEQNRRGHYEERESLRQQLAEITRERDEWRTKHAERATSVITAEREIERLKFLLDDVRHQRDALLNPEF